MSHPLQDRDFRSQWLQKRAAVKVERVPPYALKLLAEDSFVIAKDQEWAQMSIDPRLKVLDPEGKPIAPMGEFWISVATFDPFHLVTDLFGEYR